MPRKIDSLNLHEIYLDKNEKLWVYNGLDCCITHEIYGELKDVVAKRAPQAYNFERNMVGAALSMILRGLRIDEELVVSMTEELKGERSELTALLNDYANAIWGRPLNPASPKQLMALFYEELEIPPVRAFVKGTWKTTLNRKAMEAVQSYPRAKPLARCILAIRDIDKQLAVLECKRSKDGRLRTNLNVAGTETWRCSSSESPFWDGTNCLNITDRLRPIVIPDEGKILLNADLEQAESRVVAYLSGDPAYIAACEGPDLHTEVCRMVWPELDWPKEIEAAKEAAEQPYYRDMTRRDTVKRGGHGTNYGLQAASLARHMRIQQKYAVRFQLLYYGGMIDVADLDRWHKQDPGGGFGYLLDTGEREGPFVSIKGAFPGIRSWHHDVETKIQTEGCLTNPFGFTRQFWAPGSDPATIRKAIAFGPQSTIAILLWKIVHRIWRELPQLELLLQIYDAVLGQTDKKFVDKCAATVLECMNYPFEINGRRVVIPSEIKIGMNWGRLISEEKAHEMGRRPNLSGLKAWKPNV